MPQPGSHAYDLQKQKLRHQLEEQGVDDETAEDVADAAMKRQAETGDAHVRPKLPPQASPSANPPGQKNRKPDDELRAPVEDMDMTNIAVTEIGTNRFGVEIDEGDLHTGHTVIVPDDFFDELGPYDIEPQRVVKESVAFLLDREVSAEIDDSFTLDDVADRYPEYFDELRARLSAG
jgi:hypothetical protein